MKQKLLSLLVLLTFCAGSSWAQNLDRTSWTVLASSACNDGSTGQVIDVLDGNANTYWHSNYGGTSSYGTSDSGCPHAIQIDLGEVKSFYGISIQNRGNATGNGRTKNYEVYVSNEAFTTSTTGFNPTDVIKGDAVLTGTFEDGQGKINSAFSATELSGQYVLFVVTSSYNNTATAYACISEINLVSVSENQAKMSKAINAAKSLTIGTGFCTYKATLSSAITEAEEVYDQIASKSSEEIDQAIATLNAAILAADNTPGSYTLKTNGRNGNNYLGYNTKLCGTASTAATADAIKFEATEAVGQYILSIGNNYFLNCTQSTQVNVTQNKEEAKAYTITKNNDGTFGIQSIDGGAYQFFHLNDGMNLVGWDQTSGASKWIVEEIKQYVTLTYEIKDGENLLKTITISAEVGNDYPTPTVNPWVTLTGIPSGKVSTEETVTVGYTSSIKTFSDVSAIDQWYTLDVHGNESNYQIYNSGDNVAVVNNQTATDYQSGTARPDYAWAFIGNALTGVKVYNNGAQKFLKQPSNGDVQIVFDAEGDLFQVMPTTQGLENSFALKIEDRTYYINHRGTKLQGWTAADGGSSFRAWAVGVDGGPDWASLNAAITAAEKYTIGTGLGEYKAEDGFVAALAAAKTMYEEKTANQEDVEAAVASIATNKLTINQPATGSFLRVCSANNNTYLSCENSANKTAFDSTVDDTKIFYFDGTSLLSLKTGYYIGLSANMPSNMTAPDSKTTISFVGSPSFPGTYNVTINATKDRYMYLNGNAGNGSVGGMVNNDNKYTFTLEQVTTLPVTLTTVDEHNYATFYTPVGISALSEGVEAYVATLDQTGEMAKMQKIDAIPANTAVVLYAEDAATTEATLTVGEVTPTNQANILTGTVATKTRVDGALTLQNKDALGFYKYAGTNLNGFRAYIDGALYNNVKGLALDFDMETIIRGIEEAQQQSAEMYDLSGRRIQKAQKGIYIVNGKKVIK
ncbi:MAG: discoidin domain-containing protein [Bacteroidales bacterium]|nr:discoidin domain-containing protein [Candidatus Physcousia equi]